eukprot:4637227-Amphidinium_carterae.1
MSAHSAEKQEYSAKLARSHVAMAALKLSATQADNGCNDTPSFFGRHVCIFLQTMLWFPWRCTRGEHAEGRGTWRKGNNPTDGFVQPGRLHEQIISSRSSCNIGKLQEQKDFPRHGCHSCSCGEVLVPSLL